MPFPYSLYSAESVCRRLYQRHKLFTFTKGLIARAVDGGVRFAYFFPEDGFFVGHIFFANRNRPAVGLTLEAGTLGRR